MVGTDSCGDWWEREGSRLRRDLDESLRCARDNATHRPVVLVSPKYCFKGRNQSLVRRVVNVIWAVWELPPCVVAGGHDVWPLCGQSLVQIVLVSRAEWLPVQPGICAARRDQQIVVYTVVIVVAEPRLTETVERSHCVEFLRGPAEACINGGGMIHPFALVVINKQGNRIVDLECLRFTSRSYFFRTGRRPPAAPWVLWRIDKVGHYTMGRA